jgi:peptidoglycan/LPS O-acetylase OafA/YrhL
MTLLAAELPQQARSKPSERRFRPDIEGLRAFAVAMVVLYHAGAGWLPGGYVGVDVFFVLSGFLITGILFREADQRGVVSISGFYARRARRILPASILVIVATVVASHFLLNYVRARDIYTDARWATGFLANYHFSAVGTDYLQAAAPPSPLQHFWSLAVEEQFYVVWPLAVLLVAKLSPRHRLRVNLTVLLSLLTVASIAWSVHDTAASATTAYFSPFTRAWELGVGALLALAAPALLRLPQKIGPWLGCAGAAAVIAAALMYTKQTAFPGYAAALPVLGVAAVVAAGTVKPASGVELVLRLKPLQWIGQLSYSLYLWHWPILIIAAGYVGHDLSFGMNMLLVGAALLLSFLTFHLLEDPMRRSPRLIAHTSNSLAFGAAAIAASVFVANIFTSVQLTADDKAAVAAQSQQVVAFGAAPAAPTVKGKPAPVSAVAEAVIKAAAVTKLPVGINPPLSKLRDSASPANYDGCQVNSDKVTSPSTCRYGDVSAKRTVVLFGDSHASQWLPALAAAGTAHHFVVVVLTKSLCPFPTMTIFESVLGRTFTECNTWRSWALAKITTMHPDMVVISSTAYGVTLPSSPKDQTGVEAAWTAGFAKTIAVLKAATSELVIIGDAPVEAADPGQCLASHASDITQCSNARGTALAADHDALQVKLAKDAHVKYVNVADWFCTPTLCPMVVAGMVTHFDQWHLTAVYSASLTKPLAAAVGVSSWK